MSRKLLLSSIAIAATATLLGVGTYAKYSDKETGAFHTVTAGTMDLQLTKAGSDPEWILPFTMVDAKPGDHGHKMISFHNAGTVDGKLFVKVVMDSNEENGIIEPETEAGDVTGAVGQGELGGAMTLSVDGIAAMQGQTLTALDAVAAPGAIWDSAGPWPDHIWPAGHDGSVSIDWSIPSTVGSEIMTDSVSFHLEFTLLQA